MTPYGWVGNGVPHRSWVLRQQNCGRLLWATGSVALSHAARLPSGQQNVKSVPCYGCSQRALCTGCRLLTL
jgi:hypothetical protein